MKIIGLIILIYLLYKLIWFFISSSSLKKKMKHLGILILVYISLWLLFFIHTLILKQNCLWDLDDKIEDYKISLGELPHRSKSERLEKGTQIILPPKSTSESNDQLRRVFERQLKELIEDREKDGLFENMIEEEYPSRTNSCHQESWGRQPRNWGFIFTPFDLTMYSSPYYDTWWSVIPTN
jgi:hypothetical protein